MGEGVGHPISAGNLDGGRGGIRYLQETWLAGGYPIPAGNLGVCGGGGENPILSGNLESPLITQCLSVLFSVYELVCCTGEKALKKKLLCGRWMLPSMTNSAITELIFLSRASRKPPAGYTLVG